MKVYTCTGFEGHYPVGTSAVIVALDVPHACVLMAQALKAAGLDKLEGNRNVMALEFKELDLDKPIADILQDGNY